MQSSNSPAVAMKFIAAAFFFATNATAQAQNPKQPQAPRTNFDCTGTVKAVDAGMFQLAADDGEQWLVKVEAQPKDIAYNASADASILQPGMFVRISSKLNRRGQTDEKISDWTVFTPRAD